MTASHRSKPTAWLTKDSNTGSRDFIEEFTTRSLVTEYPLVSTKYKSRSFASAFVFCGVYWTKFECISSRILMRATNQMRLGHARGLACAKTKKFPCIFLASPPSTAKRPREWKGNLWFCFAVILK